MRYLRYISIPYLNWDILRNNNIWDIWEYLIYRDLFYSILFYLIQSEFARRFPWGLAEIGIFRRKTSAAMWRCATSARMGLSWICKNFLLEFPEFIFLNLLNFLTSFSWISQFPGFCYTVQLFGENPISS